jgi:hypothetical protein
MEFKMLNQRRINQRLDIARGSRFMCPHDEDTASNLRPGGSQVDSASVTRPGINRPAEMAALVAHGGPGARGPVE